MKRPIGLSQDDKRLIFWMGLILVAFGVVVARLMTGTWLGFLLGVGYVLLWLSPIAPGIAAATDKHDDDLSSIVKQRDEEIAKLRAELSDAKLAAEGQSSTLRP